MTLTRELLVVAPSPEDVSSIVEQEVWGRDIVLVWAGQPSERAAIGLPPGLYLYEVRAIFRAKA